jgi:hypothetical protein
MARQGELFGPPPPCGQAPGSARELPLQAHQLQEWQARLATHQHPLLVAQGRGPRQGSLFGEGAGGTGAPVDSNDLQAKAEQLNPLLLRPQPLSFWRWPTAPQQGAALYFVADRPAALSQPLLLYVGETGRADQRWKGEHDCKAYLAAYSEALLAAGLACQLSIRFWLDVPAAIRPRRALEQALIQRWLPPFNKETRSRWATPFQADSA